MYLTYLYFVCIHTSICNKNFSIFNSLWLIYSNFFIQKKAYNVSKDDTVLNTQVYDLVKMSALFIKLLFQKKAF